MDPELQRLIGNGPIATFASPSSKYDVRSSATGATLMSAVDLETALKGIERLDAETGSKHIAHEIFVTDKGNIG